MPQVFSLDRGWRFHRGDIRVTNPGDWKFERAHWMKTGKMAPATACYDDAGWRTVDLPHDWAIEGVPDPAADADHGCRVGGVGWYRRLFVLPPEAAGQRVWLEFDGVYRDCEVWVNGHLVAANTSGYVGFRADLSEVAVFGVPNAVAVRVDASEFEGWWYEGAGIYRHVRLVVAASIHVVPDGVFARAELGGRAARLLVDAEIARTDAHPAEVDVEATIATADGRQVGSARDRLALLLDSAATVAMHIDVTAPRLWTPAEPHLCRLAVTVRQGGVELDRAASWVGFRSVAVDPDRGFLLNGKPLKLKGVSCHQDFAGVGVALPDPLQYRKIELLKEMGANAYRTAHHPPAPALLDACDRLGILVLDEARMLGTSPEALSQLERLVRRDRSRACVAMWSLGNEEAAVQGNETGARIARRMRRLVHRLDGTRPVTLAMNGDWFGPIAGDPSCIDVVGFNYGHQRYDEFHARLPSRPMLGTETASHLFTRGVYRGARLAGSIPWDTLVDGHRARPDDDTDPGYCLADGDTYCFWGGSPMETWRAVAERDFVGGTFVWTGFDYRGEPTPRNRWPCLNSNYGIMDLCGFPKDAYHYYRAWWTGEPVLHLLPHWDWPGLAGEPIRVRCFSNASRVELFLDGRSLGVKEMPRHGHLDWTAAYRAGRLEARGTWADGSARTCVVETTSGAARLELRADRTTLVGSGTDVACIRISVEDARGRFVATASPVAVLTLRGPGRILGVHNGDPAYRDPEQSNRVRLFNGLALAIVQTAREEGVLILEAEADGLAPARIEVAVQAADLPLELDPP